MLATVYVLWCDEIHMAQSCVNEHRCQCQSMSNTAIEQWMVVECFFAYFPSNQSSSCIGRYLQSIIAGVTAVSIKHTKQCFSYVRTVSWVCTEIIDFTENLMVMS